MVLLMVDGMLQTSCPDSKSNGMRLGKRKVHQIARLNGRVDNCITVAVCLVSAAVRFVLSLIPAIKYGKITN